ncbi:Hypothetical predicted protein [Mytilus galloprovincialis]|uniref:Peptidase A9 domain-containing protein n=1 Tax=Mytilus galloprovincialis TaxID=29158 RepID=A0A8B6HH58_MYTGA|nr:Hypothetical predicted protein [Mytilus galloprovincialis]
MNLLTATGAASEFSGKVDLEIKLGNHVCKHEFLLAEIKDAAIIGTDFMSRFHIDILFTKGSLRIGNDFIPYFTNQGEVSCCKVSIAETVEVPPHSEMIIKGHAFGRIKYNSIGIVETNKEFIEKTGLLLASEDPIKVHKNTVAGLFEPVDVQQVVSVDKPKESVNCIKVATEKEMPEHLIEVFEKGSDGLCKENKNQLKDFLCSYADVFSTSSSDIGHTELIKHKINTGNAPPIKQRPYRLPLAKREAAEKEIETMASRAHDAEAGVATEQLKNDQVKAQVNPGLEDVNTIHNEAFTNEKCVYGKTLVCPNPGTPMEAISNKECMGEKLDSNQINPSCQGPMTYQMLMPTGETLTDVCWSDSSTKGQMDFDVRAVQTRSMKKTTPEILPNGLISSKESDDFDKSLDLQKRARAR